MCQNLLTISSWIVQLSVDKLLKEDIIIGLIQQFEADYLWKVSLKILNSGRILKTFITHPDRVHMCLISL